MRVPRPLRWLLVLAALAVGWRAGDHLQDARVRREMEDESRRGPTSATTAPRTRPTTDAAISR